LKRIVVVVTALVVLGAAASAYAAINTYSATYNFTSKKAGTASKPSPTSFTQNIKVKPGTAGNRTGVLLNIKTTIYGLKVNGKDFPTCSASKIAAAQNDTSCAKGAAVASGSIQATLGNTKDFSSPGQACNPLLHVWNAGQGKLVFFFVDTGSHQCLGGSLHTGQVGPWTGTYKNQGKNLVIDIPIPKTVDYPLGVNGGEVGSLSQEFLKWSTQSAKGKHSIASVACKGKTRPYSTTLTSTLPTAGPAKETKTVKGSAPCSK
jgi:hypothetical protein